MHEGIDGDQNADKTSAADRLAVEFDAYAATYDQGVDHLLRRLTGGSSGNPFIDLKVDWLLRRSQLLLQSGRTDKLNLLDYGCGTGTMLALLQERRFPGALAGCDVSKEMLQEAAEHWQGSDLPTLRHVDGPAAPFEDGQFDIVVASSVLHHVPMNRRDHVYADIVRLVRPKGHICIFEHNPWNPVTQWVVRHTPIDRNAVLLRPSQLRAGLAKAGASRIKTEYMLFFPPRLTSLRPLDRLLGKLPLGGQYVVLAVRT